jgi:hypothetical protein
MAQPELVRQRQRLPARNGMRAGATFAAQKKSSNTSFSDYAPAAGRLPAVVPVVPYSHHRPASVISR